MMEDFNVDAVVNAENADYYRHLKRGELRLQRCLNCGFIRQPASWNCPECLSEEYSWDEMSGRATVQTFIWYFDDVLDRRYIQGWAWRDVPYNVAIVKLEEGPQLITNIDGVSFENLKAGAAVVPKFVEISPEYAILRFVPSPMAT
jgi:uncharacterized OB-fold protein